MKTTYQFFRVQDGGKFAANLNKGLENPEIADIRIEAMAYAPDGWLTGFIKTTFKDQKGESS